MLLNVLNLVEVLAHLKSWNITSDPSSCIISERHEDNKKVHFGIFFFFFFTGTQRTGLGFWIGKITKRGQSIRRETFVCPLPFRVEWVKQKLTHKRTNNALKAWRFSPPKKRRQISLLEHSLLIDTTFKTSLFLSPLFPAPSRWKLYASRRHIVIFRHIHCLTLSLQEHKSVV